MVKKRTWERKETKQTKNKKTVRGKHDQKYKKSFSTKNRIETIKDRVIRDIRVLFEQEDYYYKAIRVDSFWNNNYIEYESNDDRNKILSVKEYLRNIITDLQKSGTWKVQLLIHKDVDEECVMHSESKNREFLTYDK